MEPTEPVDLYARLDEIQSVARLGRFVSPIQARSKRRATTRASRFLPSRA